MNIDKYKQLVQHLKSIDCQLNFYMICENEDDSQIKQFFNQNLNYDICTFYFEQNKYFKLDPRNGNHFEIASYWNTIIPKMMHDLNVNFDAMEYDVVNLKDNVYGYDLSYHEKKNFNGLFSYSSMNCNCNILNKDHHTLFRTSKNISMYHELCIGTHTSFIVSNTAPCIDKSILMISDSMGVPIIPILSYYFRNIIVVDNVHTTCNIALSSIVDSIKPSYFITINTDFNFSRMFNIKY